MQNPEQERHSWLKLSALLGILLFIAILTILGGDADAAMNYDNHNLITVLKLLQAIFVVFIFILPAVLIAIFWTRSKIHYLGLTRRPSALTMILAGMGILLAMPLINWLAEVNQHMHLPETFSGVETWMKNSEQKAAELTEAFTKGTSIGDLILNLFVIAFMAALSEEIFFRGVLQKVSIECFRNRHIGVWFGAIIFSAFHMQFFGFVPRMLMGVYLGYLFLWSGSLWPGILAHFLNNGMAVFLVWLSNRGVISVEADKVGIHESELIYVLVSAVFVVISLFLVYKTEKKNLELIPDSSEIQ
jgi:uncharacterized protein